MALTYHFANQTEYIVLVRTVSTLILLEIGIYFYTIVGRIGSRLRKQARTPSDKGTYWLIIIAWYLILYAYFYFRSTNMPLPVQSWLLPYFFLYMGIILTAAGAIIRVMAVFALKNAFTLSVQTANDQHLVQSGLYRIIRNPAYTGSIISLFGMGLAFRSILGIFLIIPTILCYVIRIRVEEKALKSYFQDEFTDYCRKTKYRLFPGIY